MLWRFYPAIMMRPIMPLARFFYGDTHKWYFRTAATVLAATLVNDLRTRHSNNGLLLAYLLSFAGMSILYWLFYAPAKWATKDCIPTKDVSTSPSAFDIEVLDLWPAREIAQLSIGQDSPFGRETPIEIELLHRYTMLHGYRPIKGNYLYEREWRPPGYWSGRSEFSHLLTAAETHKDLLYHRLNHEVDETRAMFNNLNRYNTSPKKEAAKTLTLALYLDATRPNWRRHAQLWSQKKWRRAFMRSLWHHRLVYAA